MLLIFMSLFVSLNLPDITIQRYHQPHFANKGAGLNLVIYPVQGEAAGVQIQDPGESDSEDECGTEQDQDVTRSILRSESLGLSIFIQRFILVLDFWAFSGFPQNKAFLSLMTHCVSLIGALLLALLFLCVFSLLSSIPLIFHLHNPVSPLLLGTLSCSAHLKCIFSHATPADSG